MTKDSRPLMVSIWCITYNQGPYIRECLEGFVKQKTNFRFEAIVHDDASTDETAAIIREYAEKFPDIIYPLLEKENQYSKGGFGLINKIMNEHSSGKYIAYCEGDDYWTDPLKLQKQVDFLERHKNYGLVCAQTKNYIQEDNIYYSVERYRASFNELMYGNTIATQTVVLRKELLNRYYDVIKPESHSWLVGDYPTWLFMSKESLIKCMSDVVAVYRVLPNSASHSSDFANIERFEKSVDEMRRFFCKFYNERYIYQDVLYKNLAVRALVMSQREKCRYYSGQIRDYSIKFRILYWITFNTYLFILVRSIFLLAGKNRI